MGLGGCFHPALLAESEPSRVTWITEELGAAFIVPLGAFC